MAFTTRRGRPPRPRVEPHDHGTPELQFKRAIGLTQEPIDLCLERGLISPRQHWCGLHLRWLFTLRYGAPALTIRYTDMPSASGQQDDPLWRREREAEYAEAITLLKGRRAYEPIMRLCVFNEAPAFLDRALAQKAQASPALAARLSQAHSQLLAGFSLLETCWSHPSQKRASV